MFRLGKSFILFIWQIPQYIVAWIIVSILGNLCLGKSNYIDLRLIYFDIFKCPLTLGKYVFCKPSVTRRSLRHEYGHYRQSLRLGWLYIIIVIIPFLLGLSLGMLKRGGQCFYTESWADRLKYDE